MAAPDPPKFRTEVRMVGPAAMVSFHGELDIQQASRVAGAFARALNRNPAVLAADLRGLTFMDSTGVHAMLNVEARCRRQGARFLVIRGIAAVDRVLSVLGLDRYFDMISSPDQLPGDAAGLAVAV
ncbi:MAG: STAS domain-containing protein [Solirubrobacteraceae bacterium]